MATDLQNVLETGQLAADQIAARTAEIYHAMLRDSKYLDCGNFTSVHSRDVERMFKLYDSLFFDGRCSDALGETPMYFRLSKRMTRAGGSAERREAVRDGKRWVRNYEITVSTTLLFQTFQDDHRPIVMSGIPCRDRLEALQRVMEHELVHILEMLVWVKSSCVGPRFQSIAHRYFAHTDHRHQLITPRERALVKYGIGTGRRVAFRFEGQRYVGVVNRVTKRATVLVEDPNGERYSDGKAYSKFYVPVKMLELIE